MDENFVKNHKYLSYLPKIHNHCLRFDTNDPAQVFMLQIQFGLLGLFADGHPQTERESR